MNTPIVAGRKVLVAVVCFLMPLSHASIQFRNQNSTLSLKGTASLDTHYSPSTLPITGTLKLDTSAKVLGYPISFADGILSNGFYDIILTATFDPASTYSIKLNGSPSLFNARARGRCPYRIRVTGINNQFEGVPVFNPDNAINFVGTEATFALDGELNSTLLLNGGVVNLDNNLSLGDDVLISGSGTINYNSFNLSLGQKDLSWPVFDLLMVDANNLILGSDNTINGKWIFKNDAVILGNANSIDLTNGGTLWIKANTEVKIFDGIIKGLGTGRIVFEDKTSILNLYNVVMLMNRDYTVTTGGMYVSGDSKVITGNHFLTFDLAGSLTVDGSTLHYDPLNNLDRNNVKFTSIINNRTYLNGGSVRKVDSLRVGNYQFEADEQLDRQFIVSDLRRIVIDKTTTINGDGFEYVFAPDAKTPLINVAASQMLTFTNILMTNFPVSNVSLASNSQLIFGEKATVQLTANAVLTTTWYATGNVIINGGSKILRLGTGGSIIVRPNSSLLIDNITIRGLQTGKIRCMDETSTISFGTVMLKHDDIYSFSRGRLDIIGDLELIGTSTFEYRGIKPMTVGQFGSLTVDFGMSFSYAPRTNDRGLIVLQTADSTIRLNYGTLATTRTGIRLTVGTLDVQGECQFFNDGAIADSEGFCIGDGIPAHDLTVSFGPSANFKIMTGRVVYENQQ